VQPAWKSGASCCISPMASSTVQAENAWKMKTRAALTPPEDPICESLAGHPFVAKLVHVVLQLIGIHGGHLAELASR
jgi:hypothetical protein